jgi:hypothetical protein
LTSAVESARKGNPVIYLALALPVAMAAFTVSTTLVAHHPHQSKAIMAPTHEDSQSNPATLIKPQNVKYIG